MTSADITEAHRVEGIRAERSLATNASAQRRVHPAPATTCICKGLTSVSIFAFQLAQALFETVTNADSFDSAQNLSNLLFYPGQFRFDCRVVALRAKNSIAPTFAKPQTRRRQAPVATRAG